MANNISEIANVLGNLNLTYEGINVTDVLDSSIASTDSATGGWLGIVIFSIMSLSVLIHFIINRNKFYIVERNTLLLMWLCVTLDLGFYLFQYQILNNIQLLTNIYVIYFLVGVFSFFKKEATQIET